MGARNSGLAYHSRREMEGVGHIFCAHDHEVSLKCNCILTSTASSPFSWATGSLKGRSASKIRNTCEQHLHCSILNLLLATIEFLIGVHFSKMLVLVKTTNPVSHLK